MRFALSANLVVSLRKRVLNSMLTFGIGKTI